MRDYAQVRADGRITPEIADAAMKMLEVDEHGFDDVDRRLMLTIIDKFGGGPVGLTSLAAATSEEPDAIEDIHEPFLIQLGIHRSHAARPRGDGARLRVFQPADAGEGIVLRAEIKSLATYVPPRLLTNADLEKLVETSNDWIMQRTGIRERHIVDRRRRDVGPGDGSGARGHRDAPG